MGPQSQFAAPPLPRAPGIVQALGLILLYFVLQLLTGLVIGMAVGLLARLLGHGPSGGVAFHSLLQRPDLSALVVVLTLLASAGTIVALTRRIWPLLWALQAPPGFGLVRAGAAGYLALAVFAGLMLPIVGSWITQWLAHGREVTQDIKQLGGAASPLLRIPLVVVVATFGPLVEELLFRGVLLSALLRRMGALPAATLSALLFACVHLPDLAWRWYAIPNLALLALVLAWLRLRSGSLWPAVLAHGVNNLLAVVAWFVAVNPTT